MSRARRLLTWFGTRRAAADLNRTVGDAARDRGDWPAAAAAYRRYLAGRPRHVAIWIRLGNMLKESGLWDEAADAYSRASALDLRAGLADRLHGEMRLRRGDLRGAAAHFVEAWARARDADAGRALAVPELQTSLAELNRLAGTRRINGVIEGLSDLTLEGWATDPTTPDEPATVEFVAEGRRLGVVRADRPRADLLATGLAPLMSGFRFELGQVFDADIATVDARIVGTGERLPGSPFDLRRLGGVRRWLGRAQPAPTRTTEPPVISIITPVHDVPTPWFDDAVSGVMGQIDGRWEWILVDDGSSSPHLKAQLTEVARSDPRVKLAVNPTPLGTAAATNVGLRMATADHVLFLDHDDRLEPEAVFLLAQAAGQGADLIYGDEAVTSEDIGRLRMVAARPAFSWRYYLSHPYFVHPVCVRRSIAGEGLDENLTISADVDFVLRMIERAETVAHQPGVLYRWRTHGGSVGHQAGDAASVATAQAVQRHLSRVGVQASVAPGGVFNTYRLDFHDPGGRVLVVIPTRDRADLLRTCLESLLATTRATDIDVVVIDHDSTEPALRELLESMKSVVRVVSYSGTFNYSRMNNQAVTACLADHRFVLFMNNDVEAVEPGWLERLRALAAMPDVGTVGATLLYPDGRVQHAGVILGPGGLAEHALKFAPFEIDGIRNPGYNCSLTSVRDWSAVTGACMMVRADVFRDIGGFDEALPVGFNDTDLCLRLRERGLSVINDGWAVLRHHESATRARGGDLTHPEDAARFAARWRDLIEAGDPFYSPLLSLDRDHAPEHPDTDRLAPRMANNWLPSLRSER